MKKYKDIFGNEITDEWHLDMLQRLDQLKKRNKGLKDWSEIDNKELEDIAQEIRIHWDNLKIQLDKIPISEQIRRMKINFAKMRPRLFETSTSKRLRSIGKGIS